jgi:hypothetical protein
MKDLSGWKNKQQNDELLLYYSAILTCQWFFSTRKLVSPSIWYGEQTNKFPQITFRK